MSNQIYPLFREYSLAIRDWLRKTVSIPRLDRVKANIQSMTMRGTSGGGANQHEIIVDTNLDSYNRTLFQAGHPVVLEGTIANDGYYTIEKVVGNNLILNQSYKKLVSEQPTAEGMVKRTINVIYGAVDRALADIAQPLRNGTIDSPGIAFYISDYMFKIEKSRPPENYYTRKYKDNNNNILSVVAVPPLLEYQVHYSINVWAVYQQEMDILNYQIATEFNPSKFYWIGDPNYGFEYNGDREEREHHGQWAHALMDVISDVSDLEPGDATQRTLRSEIGFMVTNAYLPQAFDKDQSMIGAIDIENIVEDRLEKFW